MQSTAFDAIRTLSRRLKMLVDALAMTGILGAVFLLWQLSFDFPTFTAILHDWMQPGPYPLALGPSAVTGLALLAAINALISGFALFSIWRLFDRMEKGLVFSGENGILIRSIGCWVLAGAISMPVSRTLSLLIATYGNPDGQKLLVIGIGSSELLLFLVAGFLYAMGHVMALAAEIDRENRSFV